MTVPVIPLARQVVWRESWLIDTAADGCEYQESTRKGVPMDSDTLQTAGRITASLVPQMVLDSDGETAARQVASMYWTIVRELVEGRKKSGGADVPAIRA